MTTAFVFSGGASLGSVQAGMLKALEQVDIRPDMLLGCSVGAMNAAYVAGGGTADGLADIWTNLKGSRMFPLQPVLGLQAFMGKRVNFVPNDGVRRVLNKNLTFRRLEDAQVPLTVMATDLLTGTEVRLTEGNAIRSILASISLPGVFPPVAIDHHLLVDGGIANNTPISAAIEAGATEVWVLNTGYSCGLATPPRTALSMALHSVGLLVQQRLLIETATTDFPVPVHLIPAPCPITVGPTDFSHSADLIERARQGTVQWFEDDMPIATPYFPHAH